MVMLGYMMLMLDYTMAMRGCMQAKWNYNLEKKDYILMS
jgi:hypothetical protein